MSPAIKQIILDLEAEVRRIEKALVALRELDEGAPVPRRGRPPVKRANL